MRNPMELLTTLTFEFHSYFFNFMRIELVPDPPARLSEEELLFSKQKLQKLKIFARLEIVSLQKRHY